MTDVSAGNDPRLDFPATARNSEPILQVLRRVLPPEGTLLEVGSGSGQHAVYFAAGLPGLIWQPSDPDPAHLASIADYAERAGLANLRAPLMLDVSAPDWPGPDSPGPGACAAVASMNMIHIAPWAVCQGLMAGSARILSAGGRLFLYGPFIRSGHPTAPSNAAFDQSLRAQNPAWGIRDLDDVAAEAGLHGLELLSLEEMPANNLSLVFEKA